MLISPFLSTRMPKKSKDGKDGTLVVLRDVPQEYMGRVYLLDGDQIPYDIVLGSQSALDYVNNPDNKVKWVASLGIVDHQAVPVPPKVFEEVESKGKDGKIAVSTVERWGTIDEGVKSRVLKLFKNMPYVELVQFCSLEQMLGMVVNETFKQAVTPESSATQKAELKKKLATTAKTELKKRFNDYQRSLLMARLTANQPKLIEPEDEEEVVTV